MSLLTLTCIIVIISGILWMITFYYAYTQKGRVEKVLDEMEAFLSGGNGLGGVAKAVGHGLGESIYSEAKQDVRDVVSDVEREIPRIGHDIRGVGQQLGRDVHQVVSGVEREIPRIRQDVRHDFAEVKRWM